MIWRVVVDTNIFISGLLWGGTPGRVLQALIEGRAVLLTSDEILNELERKLNHPKFSLRVAIHGLSPKQVVNDIKNIAELVVPQPVSTDAVRDRKDIMILACAVGGKANSIISGDRDLTTVGSYSGIPIFTAAQFLEKLNFQT